MNMTDPIADMFTRLRNAGRVGHEAVGMPHSTLKANIARVLKKEGYIADYVTEGSSGKRTLKVFLKYTGDREPVMRHIERLSKPGLRRYAAADELPRVMGGLGMALVSTSRGILTDREARKARVGGELLGRIW